MKSCLNSKEAKERIESEHKWQLVGRLMGDTGEQIQQLETQLKKAKEEMDDLIWAVEMATEALEKGNLIPIKVSVPRQINRIKKRWKEINLEGKAEKESPTDHAVFGSLDAREAEH